MLYMWKLQSPGLMGDRERVVSTGKCCMKSMRVSGPHLKVKQTSKEVRFLPYVTVSRIYSCFRSGKMN